MKSIEEQIRILAATTEHEASLPGGAAGDRSRLSLWIVAGLCLALAGSLVVGLRLRASGGSVEAPSAAAPSIAPETSSATVVVPAPPAIPTVQTMLVRDVVTHGWSVSAGTSDGLVAGLAVVSATGEFFGLLSEPETDWTSVRVVGSPGFELEAFVAAPDSAALDQSGTAAIEGSVRSTEEGTTVFVVATVDGGFDLQPGSVVAASGGPDNAVHGKIPIGTIRSGVEIPGQSGATYVLDVPDPREEAVRVLLK